MNLRLVLAAAFIVTTISASPAPSENNSGREEGEFKILVKGREVGSEKFVISVSGDSASSNSVLNFRNPAQGHQKVVMQTKLEMDGHFRPKSYHLTSEVDGKKGSIAGTFSEKMAMFEYGSAGTARKRGVITGTDCTVLDTNIFHHFIFLSRLFRSEKREKPRFEVIIPQEADSGALSITTGTKENLSIGGKKIDTQQLEVDSGALRIKLWIDDDQILRKIAVQSLGLEVVRNH